MSTNNSSSLPYDPFSRAEPGSPFDDPPTNTASGGLNHPAPPYTSNSIQDPFAEGPSSSQQHGAPPIVLYRLGSQSGRSEHSGISDSHSNFMYEDHKYPPFRPQDSQPSITTSSTSTLPHAALFRNASSNTRQQPGHISRKSSSNRGLVPYDFDPTTSTRQEEDDDALHDPKYPKKRTGGFAHAVRGFNFRSVKNIGMLAVVVLVLLGLFLIYPIVKHFQDQAAKALSTKDSSDVTGSAASFSRGLVDDDTPESAKKRTGFDGQKYELVFSDEFNEAGRTFWPGDDPYFEAMDFWYGVTQDLEWYDPRQITTRDGALVITMDADMNTTTRAGITPGSTAPFEAKDNHNLSYRSGMLQSWNKLCFSSGYIEIAVMLPATPRADQYWPGAWTMGNLGRPGYGATSDMTWPYSYDDCDLGTFPNQTEKGNTGPPAALSNGRGGYAEYDGRLSVLPGQRLSACTCPNSDHPGPFGKFDGSDVERYRGRGAPEIDIIEIQHDDNGPGIVASQSGQFAPFTHSWNFDEAGVKIFNSSTTTVNAGFPGSPLQQAVSALTDVPNDGFEGVQNGRYVTYGFEYWADHNNRDDGFITWQVDGVPSLNVTPRAVGPDKGPEGSQVGQRLIPEEPMSIVFNMGISRNWGDIFFETLTFPAEMKFDYVRIYQREGKKNIGCDPKDFPTMDYIKKHIDQYSNWETTKWQKEIPKNRLYDGC
ncbi:hypothetical protein PM082_022913 [Marasmius tenuissimus]|nr:hypothetical protein PM082_022913 [Marasmius tenuissimus]